MNKISFSKFKRPKPGFFNYLVKSLLAFTIWILLFGVAYVNMQLNLLNPANTFIYLLSMGFILALLILAGGACLCLFDYKTFSQNSNLVLIVTAFGLLILIFEICIASPLSLYLLPIPGIAILLTLLLNNRASFVISLTLSLIFGLTTQENFRFFTLMFMGSSLGIMVVANARKRSQLLNAGMLIGVLNFLLICLFGLFEGSEINEVLRDARWGFGSGLLSSFFVMGLLPVFEKIFNITTNITLLELSDLNNPILKNLILKAPGTYHHSLIVGNLAETACNAIGANSLLARIGAYYHDIGKIEKAEYFSENELDSKSKHAELTPNMSSLIITNHVKDGIEVAKRNKLPGAIIEFIAQHHGTGLIYFFYQRALENVKDETLLKEDDFRYVGPKPQTKEAAVVLLADSVEASSRTLSDPTPAKLRALTQRIINNKFIDGQLDECDLSLKDLNKISDAFTKILTGIFHSRVEYPAVSSSST